MENNENSSVTLSAGSMIQAILTSILIGMVLASFLWVLHLWHSDEQIIENRDKEWREVAAPIFVARGVPGMANTATPYVLKMMLDARTVVHLSSQTYSEPTWANEKYLADTKITIEPVLKHDWYIQK